MENAGLLDHLLEFVRKTSGRLRLEALDVIDQTLYKLSLILEDLFDKERTQDSKPVLFVKRVKEIILFHYLEIEVGLNSTQLEKCVEFNRVMTDLLSRCEDSRHTRQQFVLEMRKNHKKRVIAMLTINQELGKKTHLTDYDGQSESVYLNRTDEYEAKHGDFPRCVDTAYPCRCTGDEEKEENALGDIKVECSEIDLARPVRGDFKKAALYKKAVQSYDKQKLEHDALQVNTLGEALEKEAAELHPGGGTVTWTQHMKLQYSRNWLEAKYSPRQGAGKSIKDSGLGNYVTAVGLAMATHQSIDFKKAVKSSLSGEDPEVMACELLKQTE